MYRIFCAMILVAFIAACGDNGSFGTMITIPQLTTSDCSYPVENLAEVQIEASNFHEFGWHEIHRSAYKDNFVGCLRTERRSVNNTPDGLQLIVVKMVDCGEKVCDIIYEGNFHEI